MERKANCVNPPTELPNVPAPPPPPSGVQGLTANVIIRDEHWNMTLNKPNRRTDEITITFTGPERFRQELVDAIYELLTKDDFIENSTRPGCGFTFNSSLPPSDEVMI